MKRIAITLAAAAAFASSAPTAAAELGGAFSRGSANLFVTGGVGYAFNESYLVLGVGLGYYVIDGLNVGLSVESWTGSSPKLYKVTPSVTYVFQHVPLNPYIGAFYRRAYVDGLPDIDSAGGRAGIYFPAARNAYVGVGVVYESYLDCKSLIYNSCSATYPEITFTLSF